jgi:hypothetical protein
MAEKTKEKFVSPTFDSCNICKTSFNLWMFQGGVKYFVLIVHFLNDKWEPCHVIVGFLRLEMHLEVPWFCK